MDVGLGRLKSGKWARALRALVLILVLVDVGLGHVLCQDALRPVRCLNPCFSGCWSRTSKLSASSLQRSSLNPCFSGCWSRTPGKAKLMVIVTVLILVLVDVGLGRRGGHVHDSNCRWS